MYYQPRYQCYQFNMAHKDSPYAVCYLSFIKQEILVCAPPPLLPNWEKGLGVALSESKGDEGYSQ